MMLTIQEVAKALAVSVMTIYRMMRRGEFPRPLKIGKCSRWKQETVDAWLNEKEDEAEGGK